MKEVREQQLCDQRRHIGKKHWLEELEMETILLFQVTNIVKTKDWKVEEVSGPSI